ncbi:MAG: hypothetical protein GY854_11625 [Deltaproteobacteria bacterium]|nr:hypothetical protein [Deltaproteobacteria bacterium]
MIRPEDADVLLEQLERLGATLGVSVRYEVLGQEDDLSPIRSGLCRLKDNQILLVDSRLSIVMRCQVLAAEFKRFDLSCIFISPAVRRLIEDTDGEF